MSAAWDIPPVAIVVSRYNGSVTSRLLEGALREYTRRGGSRENVAIVDAPGAYELPVLSLHAAQRPVFRGVLAIGCIVRGETAHDRYLADAVAHGLVQISLQTGKPVAFGVLTVESLDQALARAGGAKGDKGEEAMAALLDTIRAVAGIDHAATPEDMSTSIHRTIAKTGGRGPG